MYKRVHLSLSESQNHFLCELSKKWGQKKSNIVGYYLEEAAEKEGIFFDESNEEESYIDKIKNSLHRATYEHQRIDAKMREDGKITESIMKELRNLKSKMVGLQTLLDEEEKIEK
tara:strand:- start:13286 stop:13630 length:345 start_codon:yes stop_codon:yes gene_type:complete